MESSWTRDRTYVSCTGREVLIFFAKIALTVLVIIVSGYAAVIGGISTLGGSGILAAVLVGASVWAAMNNGLQFAGAPVALRNIVIGVIVILAVLIDVIRRTGRISACKKSA